MTDLFLNVFNASVAASWVVLAVIAARLLLKKAPRWMVCALWALVAVRLLLPGFWEAPFSLIPSPEIIPPQSLFDAAPVIDSGMAIIDNAINPIYTESLRPMPGSSVNPLQVWLAVFANIWFLGMAAMVVWAFLSCRRVRRQIRERIRLEGNVYLCDRVESPFIFGLLRPLICLPSNLDGQTRDHVIAHEQAHLSRRDHWWKPLGFALLTLNWFNPIMWLAYILLCRDIEMACDERVAKKMDVNEKKAYSTALLQCSIRHRYVTVCPLAFGEVGVKQRIKSVLHYKKPAFWVILLTAVVIGVLAAGALTDPVEKVSELRYNGQLYVLFNDAYSYLPSSEPIGDLVSILHNTTEHPYKDFQATNLDESLTGCPIYLDGSNLYLVKFDGTALGFTPKTPQEFPARELRSVLKQDSRYDLSYHTAHLESSEQLQGSAEDALKDLLRDVADQDIPAAPSHNWEEYATDCDIWLTVDSVALSDSFFSFFRTKEHGWVCVYRSEESGDSAWRFDGTALDNFFLPYTRELKSLVPCFPAEFDPWLFFETYEQDDTALRIAIPGGHLGGSPHLWRWDQLESSEYYFGLRCRPSGREDWMSIRYYWSDDTLYGCSPECQMAPISLPNGLRGRVYYTDDPGRWHRIILDTTRGHLHIDFVRNHPDWTDDEYRMALSFLCTLSVVRDGESVLPSPDRLGITMSVQNADSKALKLVCIQQGRGAEFSEIITGSEWTVERLEETGWVSCMPRELAWDDIAYLVNMDSTTTWSIDLERVTGPLEPGHYRISKTFWGHPHIERYDDTKVTIEAIRQTCYAEFDLNPLGISLSVSGVTPSGLTLLCEQDGTLWDQIITGAPWHLEQWTEDGWVSRMPEFTAWTSIAYQVNQNASSTWNINWSQLIGELSPGLYRVSKNFTGIRRPPVTLGLSSEKVDHTVYAEFIIE